MSMTTFRSGEPQMVDYTPGAGNVSVGDVVLLGNTTGCTTGIAHHDIVNAVVGALAVGGGIYACVNLNNAANYARVYWDSATSKITTVSTNMATFGFIIGAGGAGANTTCYVLHMPYVF